MFTKALSYRQALATAWSTVVLSFSCASIAGAEVTSVPEPKGARLVRGREIYVKNCFICHQLNGQGLPGSFPPLAASDFLRDEERTIRALCEGLSGEITVQGRKYSGSMAPIVLDDAEVADVLTYVLNSWGNAGGAVTPGRVKEVRAKTQFPTIEALRNASTFAPLPAPPSEFSLREVARLPAKGVRLASDGKGETLYVLCENGDVWRLATRTGLLRQILWGQRYLDHRSGDVGGPLFVLALALDSKSRLYIGANQANNATLPVQNRVTIYRTTSLSEAGDPIGPRPWFETNYPGNSAYVHGLEHIAFGPDGFLYAGNGARTDAGQAGSDTNYFQGGETPVTSSIWRLDPESPRVDVFARGVRNAYGFCWNERGEMFATENGPDADAPEELNLIERGRHYGFPYQFGDWTHKAYAHTPDPPQELKLTLPIPNLGPDGGFAGKPVFTFDPHSGPDGLAFLGGDFPAPYRNTFVIARFGNFIRTPKDNVGFDLLHVRLRKDDGGKYLAEVKTLLAPLARPIDVHVSGKGKIYICEYTRSTNNQGSYSLPGRILELSVTHDAPPGRPVRP